MSMTLGEFKAWMDGYIDGKDGLNAEQVAAVRDKLGMVVGDPLNLTPFRFDGPTYWPAPGVPFPAVTCGQPLPPPDWLKSATLCNTEQ
jgi:hypothetical protein